VIGWRARITRTSDHSDGKGQVSCGRQRARAKVVLSNTSDGAEKVRRRYRWAWLKIGPLGKSCECNVQGSGFVVDFCDRGEGLPILHEQDRKDRTTGGYKTTRLSNTACVKERKLGLVGQGIRFRWDQMSKSIQGSVRCHVNV
jgi:hypothetical protein